MNETPEKCLDCTHAVIAFESVHQGWCKYQMETVVRCDCNPVRYRVGCACAEMYCEKRRCKNDKGRSR